MCVPPRLVAGTLLALLAGVFIACGGRGPFNPSADKIADKDYGPPKSSDKEGKDKGPPVGGDPSELKVTPIALDAAGLLPCMTWTDGLWIDNPTQHIKGSAFYALDGNKGILYRLSGPGYRTVTENNLGRKVMWLSEAPNTLVVTVAEANEVWLVDPATLQVKKKIAFQGQRLLRAVSSQVLNFLAASCNFGDDLYCIDLLRGDQVKVKTTVPEYQHAAMLDPVMAPNDHHLFTRTSGGHVLRWICGGGTFEVVDKSPRLHAAGLSHGVCLSADGRRMCEPVGPGNPDAGGSNRTIVFSLPGFKKQCVLDPNTYPAPVGFDPNNDAYSGGAGTLMVFNSGGQKSREYKVGKGNVRQILVHLGGRKLLLLQDGQLSFVEVNLRFPPD